MRYHCKYPRVQGSLLLVPITVSFAFVDYYCMYERLRKLVEDLWVNNIEYTLPLVRGSINHRPGKSVC